MTLPRWTSAQSRVGSEPHLYRGRPAGQDAVTGAPGGRDPRASVSTGYMTMALHGPSAQSACTQRRIRVSLPAHNGAARDPARAPLARSSVYFQASVRRSVVYYSAAFSCTCRAWLPTARRRKPAPPGLYSPTAYARAQLYLVGIMSHMLYVYCWHDELYDRKSRCAAQAV